MNDELKKDEKYRNKYMKTHKMLTLLLDKKKDADIIRWLEGQENRSKAVRTAIRNEIAVEDSKKWIISKNN